MAGTLGHRASGRHSGIFGQASAELLDEVDQLTERSAADRLRLPYGTVPWSIVVLHLFWDAWVHERDIVVPLGRAHESPEKWSCVPSVLLGTPLDEAVVLNGTGGGLFHLEARDGSVSVWVGGDDASRDRLRGKLPDVIDSLIGRGPQLTEVLHGPVDRVERLARLRRFILTPVV